MEHIKQNAAMVRGEQALRKEHVRSRKKNSPHYKIEEDDILLLTGSYANKRIKELWFTGPKERDYIYQYLYSCVDPEVQRIIKQFFCK